MSQHHFGMEEKTMTKKLFAVLVALCIVISAGSSALAYDEPRLKEADELKFYEIGKETIIETITEFKKEFPEADISIDEALALAEEHSKMTTDERINYYRSLKEQGPRKVYSKTRPDGSEVTLLVYTSAFSEVRDRTLGTLQTYGSTNYYSGTKVWVKNLFDFWTLNVHYYVDHYHNPTSSTGSITSTYSPSGNGSMLVTPGYPYIYNSTGAYSDVRYELYQIEMLGGAQPPSYIGTACIVFDAGSLLVSTQWIP